MSGVDTRHVDRDSLFLSADLRFEGDPTTHRVRVRNLSALGMMAEGDVRTLAGTRVVVSLRNIPPIDGSVAWVHGQRFGIAFAQEIDPKAPRSPVGTGDVAAPRYAQAARVGAARFATDPKRVRNI